MNVNNDHEQIRGIGLGAFIGIINKRSRPHALPALALWFLVALCFTLPACERPRAIGDLVIEHSVPVKWNELEPGLEFTRMAFTRQSDKTRVVMAVMRVDPARFEFKLLSAPLLMETPLAWVDEMMGKTKAVAAVNASFYVLETDEPVGLVVSDAGTINPWRQGAGSGVFRSRDSWVHIEWAKKFSPSWKEDALVIQSGPLVVEPGRKPGIYRNTKKYRARTAIGVDEKNRVIISCTMRKNDEDPELSGIDLFELMQIMLLKSSWGGLGLATGLNLDGGTSSAMSINHPNLKLKIRSTHPVRNGIAIVKRSQMKQI